MSRLVIDARESGTSTGRYIDKLVGNLVALKPPFEMVILTTPQRVEYLKSMAPGFRIMASPFKEFTFGEQTGLRHQLDKLRPDLVHFGMTQQPVLYRGRTVTTMHDLTTLRFRNPAKFWPVFKIKQLVYRFVVKRVARTSAAILTGSQYVKDDLVRFTGVDPAKITVTYEAADAISEPAELVPELESRRFVLYVGRPMPHKNLERLVEAFALLQVQRPALRLVLVGKEDANYRRLAAQVRRRGLKHVVFTGFMHDAQLRWLYENCAVYVFPSLSEGFGLPGLEAMMHGAPVVSSNATCLPEIYGTAARYFDPQDVADMARAIEAVLGDRTLRRKLITSGQRQAAGYSWRRTAEQTLAVYEKLLGG